VGLSDTISKGTHPARFGLIWFSGFRGEDLNVKVYDELSIAALVQVKMSSNFNCSYIARSSLTYIPFFLVASRK
jgi:hypothetical protein